MMTPNFTFTLSYWWHHVPSNQYGMRTLEGVTPREAERLLDRWNAQQGPFRYAFTMEALCENDTCPTTATIGALRA